MNDYHHSVNRQYGREDLISQILEAINKAEIEIDTLSIDDFAWFDQLHAGGIDSTRTLAKLAGLKPGMEVLDIGCGIGGSVRTLAAEFDCNVLGLDITEEYVRAAQVLTEMLHLNGNVSYQIGDALNLKFANESFDVVWNQSVFMNINNKSQLLTEIHRVLRKDGIFVFEAQMKGDKCESRFPVLWADSPEMSYMITSEEFRRLVKDIGFIEKVWEDITIEYSDTDQEDQSPVQVISHPLRGVFNLVQSNWQQKAENTLMGVKDGTYKRVCAIFGVNQTGTYITENSHNIGNT